MRHEPSLSPRQVLAQRPSDLIVGLWLLVCAAVVVAWVWRHKDRMVPLAPGVYLSRNSGDWSLLDNRDAPKGLDPPPGGTPVVEDVDRLAVVDRKHVVGSTSAGEFFVMSLRDLRRDELPEETVRRFASEAEWREHCRSQGVEPPVLRRPEDF